MSTMRRKLLVDTDIGSDIDDAICLTYLLARPDCEVLGITTVTGEADKRAMLASALCLVAGKIVPIFPGIEVPLLAAQQQPVAPQAGALSYWEHATTFPACQAVEFMRQTIRASPGEVDLLTIGPLTNIAILFRIDPEIPSLLKSLVSMCGNYGVQPGSDERPEFNARVDPHAAAIVYQSKLAVHRSIGLNVTRGLTMRREEAHARFQTKTLQPVYDMAKVWFDKHEFVTFHDPLAAVTLFDPGVCKFVMGKVEVELAPDRKPGTTHWSPDGSSPEHEMAVSVDRDRFFVQLFETLRSRDVA